MSLPTSATPSSDWRTQDTDEARRRGRPRANTSNSANLPSYGNVKWNLKDRRPTESPKRRESDSDADNGNEDELEAIEGDVFGDSDEDLDEDRSQQQSVASYRHSAGNLPTTARSPVRSDTDWTQHPVWKYNITVILENKWVKRLFLAALLISVITMCLGTVDAILRDPALVTLVYGIEATCLSSFTVELLLRWAAATNIRQIFSIQRLIDVLTVLPFYIDVVRAIHTHRALPETAYAIETGAWVRILDLVKLLRLFRFFPKSSKLMLMWRAFSQSLEGLWVLFLSLPLLIITFSTMIFYAEQTAEFWDENARLWFYEHSEPLKVSPFQSIPECFWFVIVTLTTIGYGDVVPATFPGRLIAGALMIMSLFLVAFPLTMITSQYTLVANRYAESREKAREARRDRNRLRKVNSTLSILSNVSTGQASIVGTVRSKFRDWKDVVSKNSARSDGDLNLRRIRTAPVTNGRDNSFRDNSFNRDERPKESSTLNRKTRDVSRSEAGSRVDGEPNRTPFDPGISFGTLNRSRSTLVHSASVPNLTNESIGDTFRYPMHRSFGIGGSSGSFRSPANRPASHETIEIIPSPQGSGSTSSNLAQIELVGPSSILGATTNPLPKTLRINVRDQRHLDSILRYIDSL